MIAVCVDPQRVSEIWPKVNHFIRSAMRKGDLGLFSELERDILSGNALLWLAYQAPMVAAAAITQLVKTEQSKVCMIQACGGSNRSLWIDLIENIEAYAKAEGCQAVRLMGRKGWKRILKNYAMTKIVLERRL